MVVGRLGPLSMVRTNAARDLDMTDEKGSPYQGLPALGRLGKALYLGIAVTLLVIALGVIVYSLWDVWRAFAEGQQILKAMLEAIGLTVLALAVIDVSKYLLDEEVLRERELRAASEARGALTKFLTIVTIAISLEAVVLIFEATKSNMIETLVYPVFLLFAVVAIVIALGVYQWLSAKTERMVGED